MIFAYFRGAPSLKMRFPLGCSSFLHKSMGAESSKNRPRQTPWSFHFNVLSLLGQKTILCLACGETNHFGGSSRSKHINLMTFVASYAENHGALNLNALISWHA